MFAVMGHLGQIPPFCGRKRHISLIEILYTVAYQTNIDLYNCILPFIANSKLKEGKEKSNCHLAPSYVLSASKNNYCIAGV